MDGNGIDMYDLISDLHGYDFNKLHYTGCRFWVGVIEGMYPSPPVPRRKTKCYHPAFVYEYEGKLIFEMETKNSDGEWSKDYYKIPENEYSFIQGEFVKVFLKNSEKK